MIIIIMTMMKIMSNSKKKVVVGDLVRVVRVPAVPRKEICIPVALLFTTSCSSASPRHTLLLL